MTRERPTTAVARLLWLIRHRPAHLYGTVRGYALFRLARLRRVLRPLPGVQLGKNVRLQRNTSLMAERPAASIRLGSDCIVYEDSRLEAYGAGSIHVGASGIMGGARISCRYSVSIGDRFLSSWNVFIQDFDPHPTDRALRAAQVTAMAARFVPRFDRALIEDPGPLDWTFPGEAIHMGDDVWLGAGTTILKGVSLGDGCIVAAGSVVLRGDYPANSVVAGNPARIVASLSGNESG